MRSSLFRLSETIMNIGKLSQSSIGQNSLFTGKKKSSLISYKSHGRIENYPQNQNLIHVISHEAGHVNHNRLSALAKGESINQEVNYTIHLTGNGIVAEGVTKVTARTKSQQLKKENRKNQPSSIGADNALKNSMNSAVVQIAIELSRLKGKLFSAAGKSVQDSNPLLAKPLGKQENSSDSPQVLSQNSATESNTTDNQNDRRTKLGDLFLQIKELEESLRKERSKSLASEKLSEVYQKDGSLSSNSQTERPLGEEEHIDLTRGEEVALQSHSFNQLGQPPLQANSFGDTFRFSDTINTIARYNSDTLLSAQQQNSSRNLQAKSDFWDSLQQDLTDLKQKTSALSSLNNFITTQASTYDSKKIEISPTINAKAGNYQVSVSQLAQSAELRSNTFDSSARALNLQGSFSLNGTKINIVQTDSLESIVKKINFGEDLNGNGVIDRSVDLNGNGTLDSYIVNGGSSQGSLYVQEDNIGYGTAGYEDSNGNNLLDGGTKEHGILASITSNQLVLRYENNTSAKGIVLSEDVSALSAVKYSGNSTAAATLSSSLGVLTFLGFTTAITNPDEVSSSYAYDFRNKTAQQDAQFSVNGTSYSRSTNTVTDVIQNATLALKETIKNSADPIRLQSSTNRAVTLIKDFVGSFNKAIRTMNDAMITTPEKSGIMRNDPKLHRIHKAVTESVLGGAFPDNNLIEQLTGLGITPNKGGGGINILSAQNVENNLLSQPQSRKADFVYNNHASGSIPTGAGSTLSALKAPDVSQPDHFTLSFDEKILAKKIATDPQGVYDLFNTLGNGIAPLLTDTLNTALDEKNGTIANVKGVIALKQNNRTKIPEALKNQDTQQYLQNQKAFKQSLQQQFNSKALFTSLDALS